MLNSTSNSIQCCTGLNEIPSTAEMVATTDKMHMVKMDEMNWLQGKKILFLVTFSMIDSFKTATDIIVCAIVYAAC